MLFSESWHLVAPLRVRLRSDVEARRQVFRGESWFVVHDRLNLQFFRLRPAAYVFLARLDDRRTVEEHWRESLSIDPENTPGQQEVVQLIAQLTGASLLQSEQAGDALQQFRRRQEGRRKQARQQVMNFLFWRIPLFDPDPLVTRAESVLRPVLNKIGLLAWFLLIAWGMKLVFERIDVLFDRSQAVLAPANLGWLYLVSVALKLWHELGHGVLCKRFGGEVRSCGILLLALLPLPFIDVTAAHAFRERRQRVLVGLGGVIFELGAAAVAVFVWAYSGDGLVNQLAYNAIFLASVTTLVFNLNPLLRFDGYFILTDLTDTPNLAKRALSQWKWLLERWVFKLPRLIPVERTVKGVVLVVLYGLASTVYRLFALWAIMLFVGDQLFGIGLVLAVIGGAVWGLGPLFKFARYLIKDQSLEQRRGRSISLATGTVSLVVILLVAVPVPNRFLMPGVVQASPATHLISETDGILVEMLARPGEAVEAGQPLLRLANPELEAAKGAVAAALEEIEARLRLARNSLPALLPALEARLKATESQRSEIERRMEALLVRAPHAGRWGTDGRDLPLGMKIPRGVSLGVVVSQGKRMFSTVVDQDEAGPLFGEPIQRVEIRIRGEADRTLQVGEWSILPGDQRRLPSRALGWAAGGTVEVAGAGEGAESQTAAEPFFEVLAELPSDGDVQLEHSRSGVAKFVLQPRPIASQAWRSLRQLFQKRYQI
ncbi:hypothetical protein [Pelagicoccus albus]|uniref:Peptide zinc metalloprotease protein n=1 Tax=Pelagicoccus albus TaxID=415222 RepID=A0A7X1E9F5_9BACT|nr:hypothetical protein [Pelagicoccus albus]MBC2607281.1 hypothetical protein [Pelagicoccus albus]